MQTISTRSLISLLVLTAFITTTLAPTAVSAQRGGAGVVKAPTASITIGGQQNHTATTGEAIPAIVWRGTGTGATFETTLKVNNPALCGGIKDGQVWGQGKTAAGNFKLGDAPKAREGCVLGFVYQVTDQLGRKATDRATLRYVAPKPAAPKPTTTSTTGGTSTGSSGSGSTATSTTPTQSKLKLLSPNGGERWMLNSDNTIITWTPEPHRDGMIAYLQKKQGNSFVNVGKVIEARKGSIQWLGEIEVSGGKETYATPGDGYYIQILDTKTGETDRSDAPFTIVGVDTFTVNLQPADKDNYLEIEEPQTVRLSWDASAPGLASKDISCTLRTFNELRQTISETSVSSKGTVDAWAQPPTRTYSKGAPYTFATISCSSPLGMRSDYIDVVGSGAASTSSLAVYPNQTLTMLDESNFPGDTARGIYDIEFTVTAGAEDIFIPKYVSTSGSSTVAGFVFKTTQTNRAFLGNTVAYIAEATISGELPTRYKISAGQTGRFIVRAELYPSNASTGNQYGIAMEQMKYATGTTTPANQTYSFPDNGRFETRKITIASAVPVGEITQTVAQGAVGEDVSRVQAALKRAGLFNEEITGYFGSITRAAVKAFQREHALENVGAVGPQTMSLMNQLLGK